MEQAHQVLVQINVLQVNIVTKEHQAALHVHQINGLMKDHQAVSQNVKL